MHKLAWNSGKPRAEGKHHACWDLSASTGLSVAQCGSHVHPQTNRGGPGWLGLDQGLPRAWPGAPEPQELDHRGRDAALRQRHVHSTWN